MSEIPDTNPSIFLGMGHMGVWWITVFLLIGVFIYILSRTRKV